MCLRQKMYFPGLISKIAQLDSPQITTRCVVFIIFTYFVWDHNCKIEFFIVKIWNFDNKLKHF